MFEQTEKDFLLKAACEVILAKYQNREAKIPVGPAAQRLAEARNGVLISVYSGKKLIGEFGHIIAKKNLLEDTISCARNAITGEGFPDLTEDEAKELEVEISIFSPPKKFDYGLEHKLIEYLEKHKPGVIISKGSCQAMMLPDSWKKFPAAEGFLEELCRKASLNPREWTRGAEIETFEVEKII